MANVIIGHTTDRSATIWLRGGRGQRRAFVRLLEQPDKEPEVRRVWLPRSSDYIACVDFERLEPETTYLIEVRFSSAPFGGGSGGDLVYGRFRTAPVPRPGQAGQIMFLFGSCNLSNIKINNVIGLVAGLMGSYVSSQALRRKRNPPDRDFFLLAWAKTAVHWLSRVNGAVVYMLTNYRQPPPPWVISPFLRLATLFGTWHVKTFQGSDRPGVGTLVAGEESAARGIVAYAVDAATLPERRRTGAAEEQRLVIVPTNRTPFVARERLVWGEPQRDARYARSARIKAADYRTRAVEPEFMLHLGDQIYFDFPARDPKPTLSNYRSAYREAWSEDVVAAHFLAQCRQYMTLDDHEIFNNFATDTVAPRPALGAAAYAVPALRVYNEYVHARHPKAPIAPGEKCPECGRPLGKGRPLYYSFAHGELAHFFVMDTRTERYSGGIIGDPGRMISCCQLEALKRWLHVHRDDLVFIVSSVPFVPEVHATADEVPSAARRQRFSLDKWCAPQYAYQREAIVRHICDIGLRRVVFLTGDMHCCYHAVMKVRSANFPTRCFTIHELAAGPIYQLRMSRADHFYEVYRGSFGDDGCRLRYASRIQHFYGLANAVMAVTVARGSVTSASPATEVLWDVIPTVGEPHPETARAESAAGFMRKRTRAEDSSERDAPLDPATPVLRGKISFAS